MARNWTDTTLHESLAVSHYRRPAIDQWTVAGWWTMLVLVAGFWYGLSVLIGWW